MTKWLKTSTKISLKFTWFTIIIVFIFWILSNFVFFKLRYTPLTIKQVHNKIWPEIHKEFPEFRNKFINQITIKINSQEYQYLQENKIFKNISKAWDLYFYFDTNWIDVFVKDVTPNIQAQKNLLFISVYLLVFLWFLSYILSIYFVKTSLNKLNDLVEYVKNLNLNNLDKHFEIEGREDDEINILALKINEATDKINKQTLSLKDFISNASHELKTPLMSINSEIDYSLKSKKYQEWMNNIKNEIWNLNNLLEELVLISKLDSDSPLKKTNKNISEIVISTSKMIEKKYKNKWLKLEKKLDDVEKMVNNWSFEIISKNLIENAFKYTEKWKITIILTDREFIVKDTWQWIKAENLNKIWERFWQEDSSKSDTTSFGLWLYLVKLLVEKHWWEIQVISNVWQWTEFKIMW